MSNKKKEDLTDFRRRQADLRDREWVKTILKARNFSKFETLLQGIAFSESISKVVRT